MCNASLKEGRIPPSQAKAIVTPRLKKPGLDPLDIKNYRPISNLSFMSKIVEKLVAQQLLVHLSRNQLLPPSQSGFRRHHSTESAILKVLADVYTAIDSGQVSLVGLLDVSAAFDTVDHDILLERLQRSFGIRGQALQWFASFVTGRQQSVRFGCSTSPSAPVRFGIPQGSSLGPILYVLYTSGLATLVTLLGLGVRLYMPTTPSFTGAAMRQMRSPLLHAWRLQSTPWEIGCLRTVCV